MQIEQYTIPFPDKPRPRRSQLQVARSRLARAEAALRDTLHDSPYLNSRGRVQQALALLAVGHDLLVEAGD